MKGKGPVVYLDRSRKAKMINAFIEDAIDGDVNDKVILDVGCGNGQIGRYFSKGNSVYAVDVKDQRDEEVNDIFFSLITDENLPYDDDFFDVVISHHVIEHVSDQSLHLRELIRVLKKDGVIYLGCPNKGSPFMAGHIGNDMVMDLEQMLGLFEIYNLKVEECYTRYLQQPAKYYCDVKLTKFFPPCVLSLFRRWYPGQCFLLRRN